MTDTPKATNPLTRTAEEWWNEWLGSPSARTPHIGEFITRFVVPEVTAAAREGYVPREELARAQSWWVDARREVIRLRIDLITSNRHSHELEAQLAEAKLESERAHNAGAREALTRCEAAARTWGVGFPETGIREFRDLEYPQEAKHPAPSASPQEGERVTANTPMWSCAKCNEMGATWDGCALAKCEANIPSTVPRTNVFTPAPEPPQEVVLHCEVSGNSHDPTLYVRFTPAIVAQLLAMRPTQEGK